jgi:phosphohistidine swiveling domain-containing protein
MTVILDFRQAVAAGSARVGGKAWNLGRLARWGFPVPRGIVIEVGAYDAVASHESVAPLIVEAAAIEARDVAIPRTQALLTDIRTAIESAPLPSDLSNELDAALAQAGIDNGPVAVRSSATGEDGEKHAFAGIHESFLNVVGREAILRSVRKCFASLWTPQALAYRRRFTIPDADVRCGVVICEMITTKNMSEPVAAGVVFTADPSNGRRDRIVIETVAGLSDKLVNGQETPARATVDVFMEGFGPPQGELGALPASMTTRLTALTWRIHWDFGEGDTPQDIEWAFDGKKIVILQTRPITALPLRTFPQIADQPTIWTNANFKEVLSGVLSPMGWSPCPVWLAPKLFDLYRLCGYAPPEGMQIIRRFEGRPYVNASALQYAGWDGWGVSPADFNVSFGGFQPEIHTPAGDPMRGRAGLRRSFAGLKLMCAIWTAPRRLPGQIDRILRRVKELRERDLSALSDAEVLQLWFSAAGPDWQPPFMLVNSIGGVWLAMARGLAAKYLPPEEIEPLLGGLMSGRGGVTSAEHAYELHDIVLRHGTSGVAFDNAIEAWLDKYGHRGFDELDIANPRWSETPEAVKELARNFGKAAHSPQSARRVREEAQAALRALPIFPRLVLGWLVTRAQDGYRLREHTKSALVAVASGVTRHFALEFGNRFAERGVVGRRDDVFMLTMFDLWALANGDWSGEGARELIEDRRKQWEAWRACDPPPDVIIETPSGSAPMTPAERAEASGHILRGLAASPGIARGQARKLRNPNEAERLRDGGVLVARSTDPGWTPLFLLARGIVIEIGGYLSHGAIVAREFGVPAVVNVRGGYDSIEDNVDLVVDGNKGIVTITERCNRDGQGKCEEIQST